MKKYIFWGFVGLCSFLISLAIMMPLNTTAQQITQWKPAVRFSGVEGTLWNGSIDSLQLSPALELNKLQWRFAPESLLRGFLGFDVLSAQLKSIEGRGQCGITFLLKLHCAALSIRADAASLPELIPDLRRSPVQFEGDLLALFQEITWDQEHVPQMEGNVSWEGGKIKGAIGLDLGGQYTALISGNAQNDTVIDLRSQETSVILSGNIQSDPQGAYDMELFVRAADDAPDTTGPALEIALGEVGAAQNDGSIRLQQQGQIPPKWFNRKGTANTLVLEQ